MLKVEGKKGDNVIIDYVDTELQVNIRFGNSTLVFYKEPMVSSKL